MKLPGKPKHSAVLVCLFAAGLITSRSTAPLFAQSASDELIRAHSQGFDKVESGEARRGPVIVEIAEGGIGRAGLETDITVDLSKLEEAMMKARPYSKFMIEAPAAKIPEDQPFGIMRLPTEYDFGVTSSLSCPPQSKKEFCAQIGNPVYFKRLILHGNNRLDFLNKGGFANGGVCWWHSRLTRRATYLTVYRPDLPKPTKRQVLRIFDAYFWNNRVVEIPGYKNFREFSDEREGLLQKKLEDWQVVAGTIGFEWIGGLAGKSKVSAKNLKSKMDKLFEEVRAKEKIVYQKLQIPGIPVHAWLVVDMKKTSEGYVLRVTDSNSFFVKDVTYRIGDRYFGSYSWQFVPYTELQGEWKKSRAAQERYCLR